jgi:hypothetical protein
MKLTPVLKKVVLGAACGLIAAIVFKVTESSSTRAESVNLFYAVSTLAVSIPGILASLINWNLFTMLSAAYGAGIGYCFGRFPERVHLLVSLLFIVHFLGLLFVDFVVPRFLRLPF